MKYFKRIKTNKPVRVFSISSMTLALAISFVAISLLFFKFDLTNTVSSSVEGGGILHINFSPSAVDGLQGTGFHDDRIILDFDESFKINNRGAPEVEAFTVRIDTVAQTIENVSLMDDQVWIDLDPADGQTASTHDVEVDYDSEYNEFSALLTDTTETIIPSFTAESVSVSDPALYRATIYGDAPGGTGDKIILRYDQELDPGNVPDTGDFTVNIDATPDPVTNVSIVDKEILLDLTTGTSTGSEVVTISYTPGATKAQNLFGNLVPALSSNSVQNAHFCSTVTDATALECVALYHWYGDNNGDDNPSSWGNWRTSTTVNSWEGITTSGGVVTKLETAGSDPGNAQTGPIPHEIGYLVNLTTFRFASNNHTGYLPDEITNLTKVNNSFSFRGNITGPIPRDMGNFGSSTNRSLYDWGTCNLNGRLPASIGDFNNLEYFVITNCDFSGPLPSEVGNMATNSWIYFSNNHFSGALPDNLSNLSTTDRLQLSGNKFSGQIPYSFKNLTDVDNGQLSLSKNLLTNDGGDAGLDSWLSSKQSSWANTQTIAPDNVTVGGQNEVMWDAITYSSGNGGYEVYVSTGSGGPYTFLGITDDKTTTSYQVNSPGYFIDGNTYYVVVKTRSVESNHTISSDYSTEASFAYVTYDVPEVQQFYTDSNTNKIYGVGDTVNIIAELNYPLDAGDSLDITLNTGDSITLSPHPTNNMLLQFGYVIPNEELNLTLDVTSIDDATLTNTNIGGGYTFYATIPSGNNLADTSAVKVKNEFNFPEILSVSSTSANQVYSGGETINIIFTFDDILAPGDFVNFTLNTGDVVVANTVSSRTITASYTIPTDTLIKDLNVTSINSANVTNNEDANGSTITTFTIPDGKNLADLRDIGISSITYPNISIKTLYQYGDDVTNGPSLSASDRYTETIVPLGDLDGNSTSDFVSASRVGGTSGEGAIFIHFLDSDGTLDQTVQIDDTTLNGPIGLSGGSENDLYGNDITLLGDLNGDGVNDLAVSALNDETTESVGTNNDVGALHIHLMDTDGSIKHSYKLGEGVANGPDPAPGGTDGTETDLNEGYFFGDDPGDQYGYDTAYLGDIDGMVDLNGDSRDDTYSIAVTARGDEFIQSGHIDHPQPDTGEGIVYIHTLASYDSDPGPGETWELDVIATAINGDGSANGPTLEEFDRYGQSITSMGDIDKDGITDIAVGAPGYYSHPTKGKAYIHLLNSNGTYKSTVLIDSTTNSEVDLLANSSWYGFVVDNVGDIDGNGVNDLLATAHVGADAGGTYKAFLHLLNSSGNVIKTTVLEDDASSTQFGKTGAGVGDIDGNGVNDIAIGDFKRRDSGFLTSGGVHLYLMDDDGEVSQSAIIDNDSPNMPSLSFDDRFGQSVAGFGDFDGDGFGDIIVGAPNDELTGDSSTGIANLITLIADRPYIASSSTTNTKITLNASESLDASSIPATSDFEVRLDNIIYPVNTVSISGSSVSLEVLAGIGNGLTDITVSYVPGVNPLRNTGTIGVPGFIRYSVTNNLSSPGGNSSSSTTNRSEFLSKFESAKRNQQGSITDDSSNPTLVFAGISGSLIQAIFSEDIKPTSIPPKDSLSISANNKEVKIIDLNIDGSILAITLESPISPREYTTLSYNSNNEDPLEDLNDNNVISFKNHEVINLASTNNDTTPPLPIKSVYSKIDKTITTSFNEALSPDSLPASSDFNITFNNTKEAITDISISENNLIIKIFGKVTDPTDMTLYYTEGDNPVMDKSYNKTNKTFLQNITIKDSSSIAKFKEVFSFNHGDGDGNGIKDYLEDNTMSIVNPLIDTSITAKANSDECNEIEYFSIFEELDNIIDSTKYSYPLGAFHTSIYCNDSSGQANIKIFLPFILEESDWQLHIFNQALNRYTTPINSLNTKIYSSSVAKGSMTGKDLTIIEYTVGNNSEYDQNKSENTIESLVTLAINSTQIDQITSSLVSTLEDLNEYSKTKTEEDEPFTLKDQTSVNENILNHFAINPIIDLSVSSEEKTLLSYIPGIKFGLVTETMRFITPNNVRFDEPVTTFTDEDTDGVIRNLPQASKDLICNNIPEQSLDRGVYKNKEVAWVQRIMNILYGTDLLVDGNYGRRTKKAVRSVQVKLGQILPLGNWAQNTANRLKEKLNCL